MLNYPLNWNYSVDIMKNDLEFYELLMSDRTPAMTWSWFVIGWKWVDEDSKMRSYFLKSYQDYIIQPFKVTIFCLLTYFQLLPVFYQRYYVAVVIGRVMCIARTFVCLVHVVVDLKTKVPIANLSSNGQG